MSKKYGEHYIKQQLNLGWLLEKDEALTEPGFDPFNSQNEIGTPIGQLVGRFGSPEHSYFQL